MQRIATYMANILCRSQDDGVRAACRALLRSAGGCAGESEDVEFRQGIAAVLGQHQAMLAKARAAGGASHGWPWPLRGKRKKCREELETPGRRPDVAFRVLGC